MNCSINKNQQRAKRTLDKRKKVEKRRRKSFVQLPTFWYQWTQFSFGCNNKMLCVFVVVVNRHSTLDCVIFSDFFRTLLFVLRNKWKWEAARKGGKAIINFLCAIHSSTALFVTLFSGNRNLLEKGFPTKWKTIFYPPSSFFLDKWFPERYKTFANRKAISLQPYFEFAISWLMSNTF